VLDFAGKTLLEIEDANPTVDYPWPLEELFPVRGVLAHTRVQWGELRWTGMPSK
jgi:hypothetical protein